MASESSVSPLVGKFLSVRGIPTHILKAGEIETSSSPSATQTLFLVIPGNPGVAEFYDGFQKSLFSASGSTIPVWTVGHAGHRELPKHVTQCRGELYGLEDQINHKIAFIEDHIPDHVQLILIGHSIGAYMILEILRRKPKFRIKKGLLLFPTIERMAVSLNGIIATPLALYFRWVAYLFASLAYYLPDSVKLFLLRLHLSGEEMSPTAASTACTLFNPHCLNNVIFLGGQEMQQVIEPDLETIEGNLSKLIFYYGQKDRWCPVGYHEDMKARYPSGQILMDDRGMAHAFTLRSSGEMADIVWEWTKKEM